ncbi:NAD-dependent epimerase/dehydratase family protein [Marinibaculum pumilum]|uniref:NAD-dependent epimerase/dehydratase family protein n=1 Tax=Marinibaculum pumilum TaxID=1766165 RepID=A0ABV7L3I8_9PROT
MHILITGGAGYLGSTMVPALLAQGHKVTVLDSFQFGENSLAAACADPGFEAVRGDARQTDVLRPLLVQADAVIPLAALVGAPLCDRDQIGAVTINRDAIATMVDLMSPAQRLLIPISNSGYGVGEPGKFCTEESPLRPVSLYGRTKVEAEEIALARENTVSFRLATVFGMSPRMRMDLLVNDFVYRAVSDRALVLFEAHFKRNYIHVRDVARAFQHGLDHFDEMRGRAFNVGLSDANLSKWELCETIARHVPGFTFLEAPVGKDPDQRDYIVSNARIEATGFRPAHSLDDGIVELIKGYRTLNVHRYRNV